MRRLRPLDAALLVTLMPLWALFFALYVNNLVQGRPVYHRYPSAPVGVSAPETADGYPAVSWVWRESGGEATGVAVGDRLLRLGNADLRGVGPLGFVARFYEAVYYSGLPVSLSFLRAGEHREALLGLRPTAVSWQFLPPALGFGVIAVLVLLRLPGSRFARAFFLAGIVLSFVWMIPFFGGPRALTYAWMALWSVSLLVVCSLVLRFLLLFPDEDAPTSARLPAWPWLFAVLGPIGPSMRFGTHSTIGGQYVQSSRTMT
ncbi:MAG: hypothetical protein HYZ72_00800, partial [Deltaproteobacteria bacterium]|nr:hypothetical protein [Deltaproteobacteria bacterium]